MTERVKDFEVGKEGNTLTVSPRRLLDRSDFAFDVAGFVPMAVIGLHNGHGLGPLRYWSRRQHFLALWQGIEFNGRSFYRCACKC